MSTREFYYRIDKSDYPSLQKICALMHLTVQAYSDERSDNNCLVCHIESDTEMDLPFCMRLGELFRSDCLTSQLI